MTTATTDDFMNTPFSYQNSVDFLDNIDDNSASSANLDDSANYTPEDWTSSYANYSDDLSPLAVKDSTSNQQSFTLDMYQAMSIGGGLPPMAPFVQEPPTAASSMPTSPAGISTGSVSESESRLNSGSYPNLPTPPPNYVGGVQQQPQQSVSPASASNDYTIAKPEDSSIKQESVSPPAASNELNGNKRSTAGKPKAGKVTKQRKEKTSHNMIEKRYRTNINDKISALRECVPSLRCALPGNQTEDLEGLTPASKLNKATVLTKATEYINHLQHKNDMLEQRVKELQAKLQAIANPMDLVSSSSSSVSGYSMSVPIDTPQIVQMQQQQQAQQAQAQQQQQQQQSQQFSAYPQVAPYELKSRFLMGSMAGVMTTGLFSDMDNTQALAAFPMFMDPRVGVAVKMALIVGAVGYIIAPLFYSSSPPRPPKVRKTDIYTTTKMRKQVWDITSKTMNIPEGNCSIVAMFTAVVYSLIGLFVTPTAASSSSWSRAIDAQLCGGDYEINRSRLLISFIKSLTLKPSARRCMRQALHAQVLFRGYPSIANHVSQYFWNKAVEMKDDLAPHQQALLESDVLQDKDTMQRIYNLSMNLVLNYNIDIRDDEAIESVLRDQSIRAVVDIAAAWYACKLLQDVLLSCVEDQEIDFEKIKQAASVVPPDSILNQRVAVIQALLLGSKDGQYIKKAMDLINEEISIPQDEAANCPPLVNDRQALSQDLQLAIHCSFVVHFLNNNQEQNALSLAKRLPLSATDEMGFLGFVAVWITSTQLENVKDFDCRSKLENLTTSARVWIGSRPGEKVGISLSRRRELVGQCLKLSVNYGSSDDLDEGYSSL